MDGDEDPEAREESGEEPRKTRRPVLQDGAQRRELAFENSLQRFLRRSASLTAFFMSVSRLRQISANTTPPTMGDAPVFEGSPDRRTSLTFAGK